MSMAGQPGMSGMGIGAGNDRMIGGIPLNNQ